MTTNKKIKLQALVSIFLIVGFISVFTFISCEKEESEHIEKLHSESAQLKVVPNEFKDPTDPLNIGNNHNYWLDEKISKWDDDKPDKWETGIDRIKMYLDNAITRDTEISGDDKEMILDVSGKIADSIDMENQGTVIFRERWFSFDHNRYEVLIDEGVVNEDEESLMEDAFDVLNALPEDASDSEIQIFIADMEDLLDDWHDKNFITKNGEGHISGALITTSIETSHYWLEEDNYSDEEPGALIKADVGGAVVGAGMSITENLYEGEEIDVKRAAVMGAAGAVFGTAGGALGRAVERWFGSK